MTTTDEQPDMTTRLELLRSHLVSAGSIGITEMAGRLGVSAMTIRRDLGHLETAGIARRVRGGAVALIGPSHAERHQVQAQAKATIAAKLAKMLPASGAIALDSSSTILHLVRYLDDRPLVVVTNGLEAQRDLSKRSVARVVLTGGEVHPDTGSLVGAVAVNVCRSLAVRRLFMSAAGVDAGLGGTERYFEEAAVKQALAENATEVILAVDTSKLSAPELAQSVGWDRITYLVTELPAKSIDSVFRDRVDVV